MKAVSGERLAAARAALQMVEAAQGMRSYKEQAQSKGSVFPFGIYHVGRNPAALVAALKQVSTDDSWAGLLGVKNFGWEAAYRQGLPLERILIVDCPEEKVGTVVSLLLESVNVVAVGGEFLSLPQQRSLLARVRKLGRHILTTQSWPSIAQPWDEATAGTQLRVVSGHVLGKAV